MSLSGYQIYVSLKLGYDIEFSHRMIVICHKIVIAVIFDFIVGNKDDDPERKVVDVNDAQRFADQMEIQLFETSAKENKNVEEVCCNGLLVPN